MTLTCGACGVAYNADTTFSHVSKVPHSRKIHPPAGRLRREQERFERFVQLDAQLVPRNQIMEILDAEIPFA